MFMAFYVIITGSVIIQIRVDVPEGGIFTEDNNYSVQIEKINIAEEECDGRDNYYMYDI